MQLTFIFLKVRFSVDDGQGRLGGYGSLGASGPSQRDRDERLILRLDHGQLEVLGSPAAAEWSPFFLFGRQAVLAEPLDSPIGGSLEGGRAGEARAMDIGEEKQVIHDFGVFEGFGLDAVDDRQVHVLFCP